MSDIKRIFEISLTSLSQNGVSCKSIEIEWEKPSCANIKCEFDGKKIKVNVPEGCEGECIYAVVRCKDNSCSDCPDSERIKICPCLTGADCDECEECIDNLCVSKCPEGQFCDNDRCVDCDGDNPCPCNQICVAGDCQCPPNKPLLNDKGCCTECLDDSDCPPCTICTPDGCIPIDCPDGACDPETEDCVDCLNTGDCSGDNECCADKKCECCTGFVRDPFTGDCVFEPECEIDKDCNGPCEICVEGKCVPLECPDGYVCVDGGCKPICDCADPICDKTGACVGLDEDTCYCNECEGSCIDSTQCGEGCYCQDGECVPNPCRDTPCNNGEDCAEGCGCLDGECVPCASLDCNTNECAQTLGCNCDATNTCVDDPDPCASFTCDETEGPAACEGGSESRPDCGCDSNGDCVQQPCEGDFTLEKGDCELTATLESNKCCGCSDVTLITDLKQPIGQTYSEFNITIKKGSAATLADALDLPTVDDVSHPDINGNEEPLSGKVCIDVEYVYQVEEQDSNGNTIVTQVRDYQAGVKSIILDGKGVAVVQNNTPNQIKYPTQTYPQGLLLSTRLIYKLCEDLIFPNDCIYESGHVLYDYTFRDTLENLPSGVDSSYKTLSSDSCAKATFYWTKGLHTDGGVVWEDQPFRKVYVDRTGNTYVDFIDKPDENPSFDVGANSNVDNHGELWSGYYYRVSTDCGCVNSVNYQSCGTVGRLIFCNPEDTPNIEFTSCNEIEFKETWSTDCVVNYDKYNDNGIPVPLAGQLEYGIYVNGSDDPIGDSLKTASDNGDIYDLGQIFTSDETIQYIEIKWSHDLCDECTIRIDNPNPVVKDLVYETYCAPLANGNTEYTVEVDFSLITNQLIESVELNINNLVITPSDPSVTFVAEPSANIIASVNYEDCDGIYEEVLDLPDDCCEGVDLEFGEFTPDCDTTSTTVTVNSLPLGLRGNYVFVVSGNGKETTTLKPALDETNVGLIVDEETFGSSPQITVTFSPDNGCDPVIRTTSLNFSDVDVAHRIQPTVDSETVCNSDNTQVIHDIPNGYAGPVTYSVCGSIQTQTLNDRDDLIIDVNGTPGQTCPVEIISHNIIPVSGQGCPCVFEDTVTTINFVDTASITFSVSPTTACKDTPVTVSYSSNVSGTLNYNFNGANSVAVVSGSGSFDLDTSTAGTFTFEPVSVDYGSCNTDLLGSYSANVVINELGTLTVIETNSSGDGTNCSVTLSITSNTSISVSPAQDSIVGNEYTWNSIGNGQVINISTNGSCPTTDTYTVACDCPTVPDPTGQTFVEYCSTDSGANITATPPAGSTILWDNGATTNTIFVSSGTYTAYTVAPNGCQSDGLDFTVYQGADPVVLNFEIFEGSSNDVCENGNIEWTTTVDVPAGISTIDIVIDGNSYGSTLNGSVSNSFPPGSYTAEITIVDNNGCEVVTTDDFDVIECCEELTLPVDGTFDSCTGSTEVGVFNSDVNCAGYVNDPTSPDTWSPPLSANSSPGGTYDGLAEGMSSSPQGGVFAAAGAWNNREGFSTTFNVTNGISYEVSFYQANVGNGPSASAITQTQIGDTVSWDVIFDGQVQTSPSMSYQGAGNQTWSQVVMNFTANTTGSITLQFRNSGNSTGGSSARSYVGIDGVVIKENC